MKSFTFDEFVHYGIHHWGNGVNGMPWSFKFYGHPVTHMGDTHYRIFNGDIHGIDLHRGDMLVVREQPLDARV